VKGERGNKKKRSPNSSGQKKRDALKGRKRKSSVGKISGKIAAKARSIFLGRGKKG